MRRSIRIGGVPVGMDLSWVVVSALVVVAIGVRVSWAGTSPAAAVGAGLAGAALLAASVLGHEVAHAVVARRRGIPVEGVRLFVFGGYTEMGSEPGDHRDELAVAVAGPVVSLLLAAVLGGGRWALGSGPLADVLGLMAVVNVAVGVFNLLPGLPLDGGRVVRALVWRATGDAARGTAVAVRAGVVVGSVVAAAGIGLLALGRWPEAIWGLAVGWFLASSAAAAGRSAGPAGSPVSAVMITPAHPMGEDEWLTVAPPAPVPVVAAGRVVGVVPEGAVPGLVGERMIRLQRRDLVDADTPVGAVVRSIGGTGRPAVVVQGGRMIGVASVGRMQAHLREEPAPPER